MNKIIIFSITLICLMSCKKGSKDPLLYDEGEKYSGGTGTSFDTGEQAFGHAISGLRLEELERFKSGKSDFRMVWVSAGNSTTARDGLGPFFNASNCTSCHNNNGRGRPEVDGGLVFRLSITGTGVHGEPLPDPSYGDQYGNFAIFGKKAEGGASINYSEIAGMFADGTSYSIRKPEYKFTNLGYGEMSADIMVSPRVGRQVYGMGLLENILESEILKHVDESDQDNDGISGKANYVWDYEKKQTVLGRFGWKANQPTVKQQVAAAFNGDLSLTTSFFENENTTTNQNNILGPLSNGGNPEVSDSLLEELTFYQLLLAVPGRRNISNSDVINGRKIFDNTGCNKCHINNMTTGFNSFAALSNQTIYPYTDMLLHDMGEGLADNRPDYLATGKEWRTPPLWGIGLIKTVNKHTYLLHDGRARDATEAILWHGGEASIAKSKFVKLNKTERDQLLAFLESL